MHGAASDALASAAAAVKAELASKALPPGKAAAAPPPSPVLTQLLLTAARWLAAAARLSAARTARLLEDPCLAQYRVRGQELPAWPSARTESRQSLASCGQRDVN